MTILIVASYPPMPCGVGRYAAQQAEALRDEGHVVDVLSPPEGDGDYHDVWTGGWRPLRLLKYVWAYDRVYLHYVPPFYYDTGAPVGDRVRTSLALLALMLVAGRRIAVIVHETGYAVDRTEPGRGRARLDRWYWRLAGTIIFHSVRERDHFARLYRLDPQRRQFEVWPHEKYMRPYCTLDRAAARELLGVPRDRILLLCIGFIQPHKGFDRAIEAMRRTPSERLLLKIVGSVRLAWDRAHAYAAQLHAAAAADPRCEVIETFLSDEMFDAWILAADYVVAPYREIWSSSVAARSKLLGRPLLAARAGALPEQLSPGSILFDSDEELAAALARIAAEASTPAGVQDGPSGSVSTPANQSV